MASTILAQKLSQVQGVGEVTRRRQLAAGGARRAQPHALNQYGIALDDVRSTIANANVRRPKGSVEDGDALWQIQANDQLQQGQAITSR